ncbi:glycoside hydrolase family 30 beta sandwich domain-containing protein [uncultured Draconibacterium sp.]|uniref:glycoside hydrolase family 30 beta sandwich domain-containing protein n=1 Tax=uncultured Draconibacterium sp. TaxID=1573823 RepID=UPI0029C08C33|nr:glycoside hydrolase family 30 beta sandwich domain-containing protein [uncultured Draconibacterium sp.]
MKLIKLTSILVLFAMVSCNQYVKRKDIPIDGEVTIHTDRYKQTVWGIGFEIQSDAIGSGNTGLPTDKHAVPHDLTPSERERFAKEMLAGFRYCRLAGGLYWRGLDPEQKYMQPRWDTQLEEIRQMMDWAGVEGVSLEYWSPAPYWKANESYIGKGRNDRYNVLKCFGPDFANDPIYKGDTVKFLKDFGEACAKDVQTLKEAGIKTSQWGMSNEPWTSNTSYSSCKWFTAEDYVRSYYYSAKAIREADPNILLISDTEYGFPRKIATGMHRPEVADLVDAYVVHTIGWDSERVKDVHKRITEELPKRPWFQNEYEYLSGGATPERCLNTAQHIMNSFQLGENPTWYWIHALKPFKNSEASGYSLGFWKSLMEKYHAQNIGKYERWVKGPIIDKMPDGFEKMEFINAIRPGKTKKPGLGYTFSINQNATAYLVVEEKGGFAPEGWEKKDLVVVHENGTDAIYTKQLQKGKIQISKNDGKEGDVYGAPHALFLEGEDMETFKVEVGVNSPMKIRSEAMVLEKAAMEMEPGTWIYNDFNWNAVGSFVKHMPWDCKVLDITEANYNKDARVFAYEKPDGKRVFVVSNRTGKEYSFKLNTGVNSKWQSYRYTPWERGENTMGVPTEKQKGNEIITVLPHLSWEFWEEI